MFNLPGKDIVSLTDKASTQILKLMEKSNHKGLKIGMKKGTLIIEFGYPCWLHFGSMLAPKIVDFSCHCWASFFDRFLKPWGGILGAILAYFGS